MSQTTSPETARTYGVERVCHIWEQARSSFYHRTRQAIAGSPQKRRGPPPSIGDEALLALIRADLATTPFTGEGHRKVWARLRVRDGVRVARKRVVSSHTELIKTGRLFSQCVRQEDENFRLNWI